MKAFLHLVVSLLLTTSIQAAYSEDLTEDKRVGEGMMLILKGEKQKAWEILFPEAKKGNVIAMFHLGSMMMRSPEYPNNLEKAQQFLKAAADRGHAGSKALLRQVEAHLNKNGQSVTSAIAGLSGAPTASEIAAAKARVDQYKNEVLRYTGFVDQTPAKITVKVFLPQAVDAAESLYSTISKLKDQFPNNVRFEFFSVIDPATWSPANELGATSAIPPSGVSPDFKGQIASTFGIKSFPAIVLSPSNGQARVITDPRALISEITKML